MRTMQFRTLVAAGAPSLARSSGRELRFERMRKKKRRVDGTADPPLSHAAPGGGPAAAIDRSYFIASACWTLALDSAITCLVSPAIQRFSATQYSCERRPDLIDSAPSTMSVATSLSCCSAV